LSNKRTNLRSKRAPLKEWNPEMNGSSEHEMALTTYSDVTILI